MRSLFFVAAASATFLILGEVARADRTMAVPVGGDVLKLSAAHPIPTEVAGQPGPLRIDGCFSDGRGTDGLTLVHHALRITNTGDRAINLVRVRFAFYDAFGDVSATRTNVAEARLDPGQTVDRISLAELSDAGPPARIACSVDAIRYADGAVARTAPVR
ncbi:MAG: hypothetical protein NVS4B13_10430 [Candidatus Elarobacter sp.]